ncbi:universal stress protein [Salisediminibacterium beveridgei]|uniref:Universal stress protein n=1 Tax=Salisediminibacterium beveridgei TaxID=632773 RepID=A0A1D7QSX1_9BACI|nr:universal stress protein [Salisediminibacterium beveridgei]AOM82087.1 Universal stress protein family [Salisediminibacterium beveridgei]
MLDTNYKRILTAFDGSKNGVKALKKAINVAKRNEAKILVAYVINLSSAQFTESRPQKVHEEAEAHGKKMRELIESIMSEAAFRDFDILIEKGNPKTKITYDYIDEYDVDLVICGHTGMDSYDQMDMGSTSENIVRYSSVDVMVVK